MKACVLASGSKGNSTYIEAGNHKILIDIGISFKDLKERCSHIDVCVDDIDTLLITHSHSDHTKGLLQFSKNTNADIYMSDKTYDELGMDIDYISIKDEFMIDDVSITTISLSHDVECIGYIIEYNGNSIVYITDTGYINEKYYEVLKDRTVYIFESNHDIEMNLNSRKPEKYRRRVVSDIGHLSNKQASYYLSKIVGNNTKCIILAHLSEEDNRSSLALDELNKSVPSNINRMVAYQKNETDIIEI